MSEKSTQREHVRHALINVASFPQDSVQKEEATELIVKREST